MTAPLLQAKLEQRPGERPRVLAPAVGYMPTRETGDNELTARSLRALEKAGV